MISWVTPKVSYREHILDFCKFVGGVDFIRHHLNSKQLEV